MKDRILIADDVEELAKTTAQIIELNNYDVDVVFNGKEALELVNQNEYKCIILDIMMPIMDGIEAVKNIRSQNIDTPVILLTAKDSIEDKVNGLDAGANDYLTKPFSSKELLARIRALIRTREKKRKKYEIGNVVFDRENGTLERESIIFNLNNEECNILETLIIKKEEKIPKEEIKKKLIKDENDENIIISLCITYLNDKLRALNQCVTIEENEEQCWLSNIKLT